MNQELQFELTNGVAVITLNRPQAYNSLSSALIDGLGEAYQRCDTDDNIRVAVITGAGDVFCTGADMSGGGSTFDGNAQAVEVNSCPLAMQAWQVRKPVIAACNGHAIGAGLGLAMQADMRVFADQGKYGFLQVRRGVVADFAMEFVLPRLVGFEQAFELLVRGGRMTGKEAVARGLAGRSVPQDQVLDKALEIANDIALHCAPLPVGLHKSLLWQSHDKTLDEIAGLESKALNHTMTQPDAVEGGLAWAERRKPQWSGRISRDWPEWMAPD
ncbi:MAG: crotonase [Halieaceae bacterium]|jgi:enoyl-CoA hydratase/carnithine racemase|nr:crotonase [Halieaceae bacterium]